MQTSLQSILLAEDNPADVFLVREAMRKHDVVVNLHVVRDGEAAIQFIEAAERDDVFGLDLVLLDLNLPRKSGFEILERLRQSAKFAKIAVAMISSSRPPVGTAEQPHRRPDFFFTKPNDYEQYIRLGGIIKDLLRGSLPQAQI